MRTLLLVLAVGLFVLVATPQNALACHKGDPGVPHGNQTTCDGMPPPDQKIVFVTSDAYLGRTNMALDQFNDGLKRHYLSIFRSDR